MEKTNTAVEEDSTATSSKDFPGSGEEDASGPNENASCGSTDRESSERFVYVDSRSIKEGFLTKLAGVFLETWEGR